MSDISPAGGSIADVIRSRRTVNEFRAELPPAAAILRGLELACWAPNHKLTEPWRYYLLGCVAKQQIVALNAELVASSKGAAAGEKKRERWSQIPGWLVVTSLRASDPLRDRENYAAVCCALQNLALALWSEGIGMKWTTGDVIRDDRCYSLLGIERNLEEIVGLIWYGYPAEEHSMKRRPLEEVLQRLP